MWHVVHTAPNAEPRVCRTLALAGLETYAPEYPRARNTRPGSVRDKRRQRVFPGYVLFAAPAGFNAWHTVRWAPGVRCVLEQGGEAGVVDDVIVDELRRRLALLPPRTLASSFRAGQRVVIDRGPLATLDALFDRPAGASDRVQILVNLLGRQLSVEIDAASLRAAV
ncbi:MAG: hypothetical protein JOZ46_01045 [Candidatus Dormibacteraeota bacterium]|nr:hypothetical protein [Candidatus Dormibacteraeota bacterium]MBV9524380.1 hypothetical protein [Candidatus Dormibacteraeota bacterium]